MSRHYSDPARESERYALPDIEVFHVTAREARECNADSREPMYSGAGWYYWYCFPGCMPDSDPCGPYSTETKAIEAARENMG